MKKSNNKNKLSVLEIVLRFFFGFLIPFITINGLILFLFIQKANITILDENSSEYDENKIKFQISSLIPVTNISVIFNNAEYPYTKNGKYYEIETKSNGTYQINIDTLNKNTTTSYVDIETKDSIPPNINIDNAIITASTLILDVNDNESGINYENIYGMYEDGSTIAPSSIEQSTGTIQFKIDKKQKLTIHVEDNAGNILENSFDFAN